MRPSAVPVASSGALRLTSEGLAWFAATAVLGAVGWLKSLNLLLLLAYVMIALLVLNGILARVHARRVGARRIPIPPVFAGEEARMTIVLQNISSKPASIGLQEGTSQWNVELLPGGNTIECSEMRRHVKRGRLPAVPIGISSGFPFGLMRFERIEPASDELVVLPALGEADADGLRHWLLRQAGAEGRSRKVLRRVTIDLADVRGVRPYRPGDSIRSIHWRSTARRRELMVREYDAAPSPELLVVVEPWLPVEPTDADRAKLEAALSLAATILHVWSRSIETRVTLVVAGVDAIVGSGPPGEVGSRESLIPLADAEGGAEFEAIPPSAFGRSLARAARVVVSSRPNSPFAASLARSTGKPFLTLDPSMQLQWYQEPRTTIPTSS